MNLPEQKKVDTTQFQTVNAVSISIAHLLHDIYSSFLAPILPLLIEKLSISYSMAGFLNVAQRLPSLLNPIIGLIADKISVRYFIIIAPSITAISMSLLGLAPSYFVLVMLMFMMGISATLFHVPAPVMMRRVSGNRVGLGMSFFMFSGEIARSIGPIVILGAVSIWGLEGTYRLIPFGLACSVYLYFRISKIKISDEFKRSGTAGKASDAFKIALPTFKVIVGYTFSRSLMRGALTIFLPVYLNDQGASLWLAGAALSVVQLAGAAGTILSGTISDKIGRKTTLMITAVISPILMWLFLIVEGVLLFPLLILVGFFLLAPMPVMLASVNELKTEHPAFINGIYMMISFIINSSGLMLIGIMGDKIGLLLAFQISAVIAVLAIPVTFAMNR